MKVVMTLGKWDRFMRCGMRIRANRHAESITMAWQRLERHDAGSRGAWAVIIHADAGGPCASIEVVKRELQIQ